MEPAGSSALWRTAATLGRRRGRGKGLPVVWFVTDPVRTPDPVRVAETLPQGAGVIFRHFGRADAHAVAVQLASLARRKGHVLLIGADPALAAEVGADGVHLPERLSATLTRLRAKHPGWIITVAAHTPNALCSGGLADAVLLSTVFESRSPTAVRPIGPVRFSALARQSASPVYALGGVNASTAKRLIGTGAAGFAAVEALASA